MRRLFFALWPDIDVRCELALRQNLAGIRGRLVNRHHLHITLCFLGGQPDESLETIMQAAAKVRSRPFTVVLDHFELWPVPKIVSLCPGHVPQALFDLQKSLSRTLACIGIPAEKRAYQPHITLARNITVPQPEMVQPESVNWLVEEFSLIESHRHHRGPVYRVLNSWLLKHENPDRPAARFR